MTLVTDYIQKTQASANWAKRAEIVMPDGVTADTRIFKPHGLYIKAAKGVHKTDVDGNVYLDFFGGHGALVFGHGYPRIESAITEAVSRGVQYATNHPLEVIWGEKIQSLFPAIEKLRFVASGTEATLLALRMARAFTQRKKIVRIATHYHGWHDFSVSGYASHFDGGAAPGVLDEIARNTILIRPDDFEGLSDAFKKYGTEIAAMIAEPVGTHFGTTPVSDEFIVSGSQHCKDHGALFILDEVITGLRVGNNGMQGILGIKPDLTCLAKASAGGMPGGVVGGRKDVMDVLTRGHINKVLHQGTFTGNPVSAAAAIAAIDETIDNNVCAYINDLGAKARTMMNEMFLSMNLKWCAYGRFSAFHIMPGLAPTTDDFSVITRGEVEKPSPAMLSALKMALILEGVDIGGRGSIFISYQHTQEHLEQLVAAFERALIRLSGEMEMQSIN